MRHSLIFTFISNDKPGIVDLLSKTVADNGGNWLESQMTKLAGKFAGIVQISIAANKVENLKESLLKLSSDDFSILIDDVTQDTNAEEYEHIKLSIIGLDRPGIVREVAQALAEKRINVAQMHSIIESAPMTGEPLFKAEVNIQKPINLDIESLNDTLDIIGSNLDLDWNLESI